MVTASWPADSSSFGERGSQVAGWGSSRAQGTEWEPSLTGSKGRADCCFRALFQELDCLGLNPGFITSWSVILVVNISAKVSPSGVTVRVLALQDCPMG